MFEARWNKMHAAKKKKKNLNADEKMQRFR